MASSDSPVDKLQRGRPKRAELPDVNRTQARKALILKTKDLKCLVVSTGYKSYNIVEAHCSV